MAVKKQGIKQSERRREKRIRVSLPIQISYSGNPPIQARTENISLLGTYLEMKQEIPLGTKLDIVVDVPDYTADSRMSGKVRCRGDVFRCNFLKQEGQERIYAFGIFFINFIDDLDRERLARYIDFLLIREQEKIEQALKMWKEKRRKRQARQTQGQKKNSSS